MHGYGQQEESFQSVTVIHKTELPKERVFFTCLWIPCL